MLLRIGSENKYETPFSGPHQITSVNDNGTVRLQKGAVEDTVNIRRLFPYKSPRIINHGGECNAPPLRRNPRRGNRQTYQAQVHCAGVTQYQREKYSKNIKVALTVIAN